MRKNPFRADNSITQTYNSGIVRIYSVENVASVGLQPRVSETLKFTLAYEEERVGINRLYAAKQNQIDIERLIRVQRLDITNQDIAVTEDGKKYRVDSVQSVDDVFPASLDLTLVRFSQREANDDG